MRTRMRVVAVLLVASSAGSERIAAQTVGAAVDTVGTVVELTYPERAGRDLGWTTDTVGVIGDAFAGDAYQFGNVSPQGLVSDVDGNLYILDLQGNRVLKYDPSGSHLATYGRPGQGPGELRRPRSLGIGQGDTIWVTDIANTRFAAFPQGGGRPTTLPMPDGFGIPGGKLAIVGDSFFTQLTPIGGVRVSAGGGISGFGDIRGTEPLSVLNRDLETEHQLWAPERQPQDAIEFDVAGARGMSMVPRAYHPEFHWHAYADGSVVLADSAAYRLWFLDPAGRPVRSVVRRPEPRRVTERDQELARERYRAQMGAAAQEAVTLGGGRGPGPEVRERIMEARIERLTFAALVPRITSVMVDPYDRVWVGVSEDVPGVAERIDVYDREGALLGELRGVPMPHVFLGRGRIGVLRKDELDVQQVVILEVDGMVP